MINSSDAFLIEPHNNDLHPKKSFNGRILAFDLARGLAVLFMVFQHVVFMFGSSFTQNNIIGLILLSLGGMPAAPVFLFLMGVFLIYKRDRNELFKLAISKGIKLFFLGYILNITRFVIPILLGAQLKTLTFTDVEPLTAISSLFIVDIFQCAGLSLIILALLMHFFNSKEYYILFAGTILICSPLVWGLETGINWLDFFLMSLWGVGSEIIFPVFPYIAYTLMGMYLGQTIQNQPERRTLGEILTSYSNVGLILLPIILIIAFRNMLKIIPIVKAFIAAIDPLFQLEQSGHPTALKGLITICFLFVWLLVCYDSVNRIPHNPIFESLYYLSRNVTVFYFVHWSIIGFSVLVIGYQGSNLLITVLCIPLVLISSYALTELYKKFLQYWHA